MVAKNDIRHTDAGTFWKHHCHKFLCEFVLDMLSIAATAMQADQAISVGEYVLGDRRGKAHAGTKADLIMHACNQDIVREFPESTVLRRGFPFDREWEKEEFEEPPTKEYQSMVRSVASREAATAFLASSELDDLQHLLVE